MKNIVFDMGNVLTKYKLSDYIGTYTEDEAQAALLKNQVCASVVDLHGQRNNER